MKKEKRDTRQLILEKALELFADRGYDAVSVADIAAAVGIKAPSLYNHFHSKKEIFDSILTWMCMRYEEFAVGLGIGGSDPETVAESFVEITEAKLIHIGIRLFQYFLQDELASQFYRLVMIEQYKNPEVAEIYVEQNVDGPLFFQERLFQKLMEKRVLQPMNPRIAALHFYAPIFLLRSQCYSFPEREEEAVELVREHIRQFKRLYMVS